MRFGEHTWRERSRWASPSSTCVITTRVKYPSLPRLLDFIKNSNSKRWGDPELPDADFLSWILLAQTFEQLTCLLSVLADHRPAKWHSSWAARICEGVGKSQEEILRVWAGGPRCTGESRYWGQVSSGSLCVSTVIWQILPLFNLTLKRCACMKKNHYRDKSFHSDVTME